MVSFWGDKEKSEVKLAALLTGSQVFESHTVDELLWGYEDPLLKLIALQKPGLVPSTVFGLFAGVSVLFFVTRISFMFCPSTSGF